MRAAGSDARCTSRVVGAQSKGLGFERCGDRVLRLAGRRPEGSVTLAVLVVEENVPPEGVQRRADDRRRPHVEAPGSEIPAALDPDRRFAAFVVAGQVPARQVLARPQAVEQQESRPEVEPTEVREALQLESLPGFGEMFGEGLDARAV